MERPSRILRFDELSGIISNFANTIHFGDIGIVLRSVAGSVTKGWIQLNPPDREKILGVDLEFIQDKTDNVEEWNVPSSWQSLYDKVTSLNFDALISETMSLISYTDNAPFDVFPTMRTFIKQVNKIRKLPEDELARDLRNVEIARSMKVLELFYSEPEEKKEKE
jgi:hypothetical protein